MGWGRSLCLEYRSFHFPLPVQFFQVLEISQASCITVRSSISQEADRQFLFLLLLFNKYLCIFSSLSSAVGKITTFPVS